MVLKWVEVYRVGIKSWGKEEDEVFRGDSRGILRQGNKRDIKYLLDVDTDYG